MADDYKDRLKTYDWKRITLELFRFCRYLASIEGKKAEQLIGKSRSIEDIVSEAIEGVLSGSRKWDPERGELIPFLKLNVIRSIYSNTKNAKENNLIDCLDDYYTDTFDRQALVAPKQDTNISSRSAEEKSIDAQEVKRVLDAFNSSIASFNRQGAQEIFNCICEGITKPAEIEIMTGIPSTRISEIKRQITNRLGGIYERLQQ